MVNIKAVICISKTCIKTASFNYNGKDIGLYCNNHKKYDMINVKRNVCNFSGCNISAGFNIPNIKKPLYCNKHKTNDMVSTYKPKRKHIRKCEYKNCDTYPVFNYINCGSGIYCTKHKKKDMYHTQRKICKHQTCCKYAYHGFPGNKKTRCLSHKLEGMIFEPSRICKTKYCKNIAIYGNRRAKFCENHKQDNMINYVERKCKKCNLIMILNSHNICTYCDPKHFNGFRLAKQKEIKHWLDINNYKYISYDKQLESGLCGRERPDFVFESKNGSHMVILEVDEHQHNFMKGNYMEECECVRMVNISQTLGMPTIFIRYNPDKYQTKEKTHNPRFNTRMKVLNTILYNTLNKSFDEIKELGYLSIIQLYYDDFSEITMDYITILEFDN